MKQDKLIVLWKNEDGTYSQQTPGRIVASTLAERMLKIFAEDHTVFVLELNEEQTDIKVEKVNA